jgi:hypothetical protein
VCRLGDIWRWANCLENQGGAFAQAAGSVRCRVQAIDLPMIGLPIVPSEEPA